MGVAEEEEDGMGSIRMGRDVLWAGFESPCLIRPEEDPSMITLDAVEVGQDRVPLR